MNYRKHIDKLTKLMDTQELLSIYDIEEGIFSTEISLGEITQTQLIKHTYRSKMNKESRFVKENYHEKAYDFILSHAPYPSDTRYDEIYVASVYIDYDDVVSHTLDPLHCKIYSIKKIELWCIKYNRNHPKDYYITKYKTKEK